MTGHDPDRDVDDLLNEDGGKIGNLYRRLPRYEPPRRLDRAVLGEAARAVHSGKAPRRQRWIVGVGSAAGLVLAAGIAWRIGHDPMSANDAAGSATRVVPVQPISEPARAKREAPAQPAAAPVEADAAPASESPLQGAENNRAAKDELKSVERKAKAARQPAAAPMMAPETPKPASPPPVASPRAEQPFPAAPEQQGRAQEFEKSSAGKSASAEGGAATDQQAAPAAARGLSSPTQPSGSIELRRDMELAPQDWLFHVRLLQRQGRHQQASESLRLFQRAHPDWTIPDDLRPLLK
jgi:hypothetical protein